MQELQLEKNAVKIKKIQVFIPNAYGWEGEGSAKLITDFRVIAAILCQAC